MIYMFISQPFNKSETEKDFIGEVIAELSIIEIEIKGLDAGGYRPYTNQINDIIKGITDGFENTQDPETFRILCDLSPYT